MIMDRRMAIKGNRAAYVHRSTVRNYNVILSRKGGKDENGVSPSELVTEWYYKNIVQEFVIHIRETDDAAKWTRGSEVPWGLTIYLLFAASS